MESKLFLAKLEHLHEMLDFLNDFCKSCHMPSNCIEKVILAAEEALVNIISYGYQTEENGHIYISCEWKSPPALVITIKDRGIPFNPLENLPPALPPAERLLEKTDSLGGYGIYLLKQLIDVVDYQRVKEENVLTLTKRIVD